MKITLQATATVDTVGGKIPARIWEGSTESGVPVKAWIAVIQPRVGQLRYQDGAVNLRPGFSDVSDV